MNTTQETPTMTAQELLDSLHQRIADGDTTVTADELQQAEASVNFTRLQTAGQQARAQVAEHQARIDEYEAIRLSISEDKPFLGDHMTKLLKQVETATVAFIDATIERNKKIGSYVGRIKQLQREGATSESVETAAGGPGADELVIDSQMIMRLYAGQLLAELVEQIGREHKYDKRDYEKQHSSNGSPAPYAAIERASRAQSDDSVTVRLLRSLGGREEGATIKVMPSVAERMIEAGNAEAVE